MIRFSHMCERCYRLLGDEEPMYSFKLVDDDDKEKVIQGHEGCLNEVAETMKQLYGKKD